MVFRNTLHSPRDGWAGFRHWKSDLIAALFVFMMSLPLSLSVAFAGQLPVTAGILSSIIGGLLVTILSGSHLSIKTPPIALAPILILIIQVLGGGYASVGYAYIFAIIILAGSLQMLLGLFRLGNWLNTIPEAVIYGILVMLGTSLMVHLMHFLTGVEPSSTNILGKIFEFPENLIFRSKNEPLVIGTVSLGILFFSEQIRYRYATILPAPMVVILLGVLLGFYFDLDGRLGGQYLVQLPDQLHIYFGVADFSKILTWRSIEFILIMTLIGSLETILNNRAIDSIDFYRRKSRVNRQLVAIGAGNILCGLIGGTPIAASLTDSTINVNVGAKTRWSSLFHALYYALFILLFYRFLAYIPLASLAAIAMYKAYSLVSPKLWKDIWQIGWDQFTVFIATFLGALSAGYLVGITIGYLSSLVVYILLGADLKSLFRAKVKIVNYKNHRSKVMVRSVALASNYLHLKRQIASIPKGNQIYLDFTKSKVIDHSFMELVYQHPANYNVEENSLELQGLEEHYRIAQHPLATRLSPHRKRKRRFRGDNTILNERQLDVLAVASVNNTKLRHNLTYDGNRLQGFSFAIGYDIKYRENKFSKNFQSIHFEKPTKIDFSDVFLTRGTRMSEQNHTMSVLLISNIQVYIPAFTLTHESLLAKVLQTVGYEDIDFAEYPSFSNYYLLKGIRESEIRKFFTQELIEFLENNQEFSLESNENKILIRKQMSLMSHHEIEDCIRFAEQFLKIIYQETQTELAVLQE